jgi:hypothetical protein
VTVARFEVTVVGRGLWIAVDDEVRCVAFRVARVVEAPNLQAAGTKAVAAIRADPKARPLPGKPPPDLSVESVVPVEARPDVNPGFRFWPDEP